MHSHSITLPKNPLCIIQNETASKKNQFHYVLQIFILHIVGSLLLLYFIQSNYSRTQTLDSTTNYSNWNKMAWNHSIIKTFLPTNLIPCKPQFKKTIRSILENCTSITRHFKNGLWGLIKWPLWCLFSLKGTRVGQTAHPEVFSPRPLYTWFLWESSTLWVSPTHNTSDDTTKHWAFWVSDEYSHPVKFNIT